MTGVLRGRFTRVARTASLVAITVAASLMTAGSASGTIGSGYCAHGSNAISSSCINSRFGETYTGGYGHWNNNMMWLDAPGIQQGFRYDHGYHINWLLRMYTDHVEYKHIEIGLRDGKGAWLPCGCRDYVAYWAEYDDLGQEHPHWIASSGPDGSAHDYQFVQDPDVTNVWQVYYDSNFVGQTGFQSSWVAYEIQTGLEVTRVNNETVGTWAHADTFDAQPLQSRNSSFSWSTWSYNTDWIDQPCQPHNGLSAYPSGSCFNGAAPQPWYWQGNKP